jgi:D-tagatose-1,6-bisphosphate aldolase subunit GatZ/KbaZ
VAKLNGSSHFLEILKNHKRGHPSGIFSVCSANPTVLEASARVAAQKGLPLLVESTCNQVNQDGGYTGMTPRKFVSYVKELVSAFGLPEDSLILGGDHLGPYPWKNEPSRIAMSKARKLVEEYILAGYSKIHLDTSMRLGDEDPMQPIDVSNIAAKAAELCLVAESTYEKTAKHQPSPVYVIGTEVPLPGGEQSVEGGLRVTKVSDAQQTIELTKGAFAQRGLQAAWERVIALVVQPGVDFGDQVIHSYDRNKALELSKYIETDDHLVYEAHSTDYQTPESLKQMVEDHFAILKVGPGLTFAFREAVYSLAWMEKEWLSGRAGIQLSNLPEVLERIMVENPADWKPYYHGDPIELRVARAYSLSDRCRYYWPHPDVQSSLERLFSNLVKYPVPMTLVSQFMPVQYRRIQGNTLNLKPIDWVYDFISDALFPYLYACGWA